MLGSSHTFYDYKEDSSIKIISEKIANLLMEKDEAIKDINSNISELQKEQEKIKQLKVSGDQNEKIKSTDNKSCQCSSR